jgi:hypothetical protein
MWAWVLKKPFWEFCIFKKELTKIQVNLSGARATKQAQTPQQV